MLRKVQVMVSPSRFNFQDVWVFSSVISVSAGIAMFLLARDKPAVTLTNQQGRTYLPASPYVEIGTKHAGTESQALRCH